MQKNTEKKTADERADLGSPAKRRLKVQCFFSVGFSAPQARKVPVRVSPQDPLCRSTPDRLRHPPRSHATAFSILTLRQAMGVSAQKPGVPLPDHLEQSPLLDGERLLPETQCLSSWENEKDIARTSMMASKKASGHPLRLYESRGRNQRLVKARYILFIFTSVSLILLYFVITFQIPLLPWLGTSGQHLCSRIYQNSDATKMYDETLSSLKDSTPNITRKYPVYWALLSVDEFCSRSFCVSAARIRLYKTAGMAQR